MDDQALRDYFDFDDTDLAANRNGEYSKKQKQKLVKQNKDNIKASLKTGAPLLAIAVILLLVTIIFSHALGLGGVIATIVLMLLCGGFAYLFLLSAYKDRKADISKEITKVKKVEGPVRISEAVHGRGAFLHVRGKNWEIDDKGADTIHQGDIYAVYCNGDGELLSLEWISKA